MIEPGPVHTEFEVKMMEDVAKMEYPGVDADTVRYFKDVYLPSSTDIFEAMGQTPEDIARVRTCPPLLPGHQGYLCSPSPITRVTSLPVFPPLLSLAPPSSPVHTVLFRAEASSNIPILSTDLHSYTDLLSPLQPCSPPWT